MQNLGWRKIMKTACNNWHSNERSLVDIWNDLLMVPESSFQSFLILSHYFTTQQPMNLKISCHVMMKFWTMFTNGGYLQCCACLHCCGYASRQTWDLTLWRGGWKEARLCFLGTTDSSERQQRRYGEDSIYTLAWRQFLDRQNRRVERFMGSTPVED